MLRPITHRDISTVTLRVTENISIKFVTLITQLLHYKKVN